MAALRHGVVRFKGMRAGRLMETPDGGSLFVYDEDCQVEIGCGLKIAAREHPWPRGLHPFFQHLTPEGWLRRRQAGVLDIAPEDDFGLLLAFGRDCIGAVSVIDPDGPARPSFFGDDPLGRAAVEGGRTLSGIQPKLLAFSRDGRVLPSGWDDPAPLIAKFASPDLPSLVANERLTMELCRLLLGAAEVAETALGAIDGIDQTALVVRRFDRTAMGAALRLEDFAQVLGKPRGNDFSGKYDAGFEDIAAALERHGARPRIDIARLFERILAYAVLGNCDCHLKNFALLETASGLRLSPVFDVLCTMVYARQGISSRFGLRIGGLTRQWDTVDGDVLRGLGRDFGLPQRAIDRSFATLRAKRDRLLWAARPQLELAPDDWRADLHRVVLEGCERILR